MMRNSASVRVADLLRANTPPQAAPFTIKSDVAALKRSTNLLVAEAEAGDARGSGKLRDHRSSLQAIDNKWIWQRPLPTLRQLRQAQVMLRIPIADVLDQPAEQSVIIRQFAAHYVFPDDVAKHPPEILVPRIRHKRSGVRDHPNETRQQADIRQSVDLRRDALLLVQEPPRAAVLDFPRPLSTLKTADQRRELKCVGRVHVVNDHLRQGILLLEQVEVRGEMSGLGKITNRVVTSVGSKPASRSRVQVAQSAQMQLLGPSFLLIKEAEEKHHERCELAPLIFTDRLLLARFQEDSRSHRL